MRTKGTSLLLLGLLAGLVPAQEHKVPGSGTDHWAFQPMRRTVPPEVKDPEWSRNPVDRFVSDRLQREGLSPAPRADRRTLLRRATHTLLGLPPTEQQLDAFLADPRDTDTALAGLVDELLASPHYGERWARHWLDLARYSDSNGLDENLAFASAWRYRDWVVEALNADMPYRDFVTMQLAGDQLPGAATDPDCQVATGFLSLGPRMLAEQDKEKLQLDVVDEQVDLVGRTFLGLTLGCARCHDHKFDPVPTSDYYAIAGIFRSTKNFEHLGHVSAWLEQPVETAEAAALRKERTAAAKAAEESLAATERSVREQALQVLGSSAADHLAAADALRGRMVLRQAEEATRTNLRKDANNWGSAECTVLHSGRGGEQFVEFELEGLSPGPHVLVARYAAQDSRPMRLLLDGTVVAENALGGTTGGWKPDHQRWRTVATLDLRGPRHLLRLERKDAVPHLDQFALLPSGALPGHLLTGAVVHAALDLVEGREPVLQPWLAPKDTAAEGDNSPAALARRELLGGAPPADGSLLASYRDLFARTTTEWLRARQAESDPNKDVTPADPLLAACATLLFGKDGWFALPADELVRVLPVTEGERVASARMAAERARAAVPPAPPTAMCVRDDTVVDLPVMNRGNHLTPAAQPTARGFLSITASLVPPPELPKDRSGRLQLAEWMFAPEHPLTARVMVSRIWQGHFGHGLVRSPSNVGPRGDTPSHPELLDWLAREFQASGWSLKAMHRLLLTSRTWQQQVVANPEAELKDPDNRLLWSQHRRRLDAESARDAVFAVAGTLDRTVGGSLLQAGNRDYVTNDQSGNRARYDAPRRALYLPIIRNAMYDWFSAFDYGDPSVHLEQRPSSATALQALQLMNSPMVLAQADALAARLGDGTVDERIHRAWRAVLARSAEPEELAGARSFLGTGDAAAWSRLCHALFCTNEFLYLD
ncbi:MAG: Xanthan lyase precursor [Planctomycetota bacterium]